MAAVTINALDAGNPLFLQNNDHSNVPIIGFKLTGTENYKMWSTAMKIALVGKNKFGFVDGTCVKPVTSPVLAQQWERCNAIVLGWILSSLSPELYLGQVYSQIASEVWDKLEETYDKMDGSVIFNVIHKINGLKQGELSVPEYYHKLNSLWREFDTLTLLPACTCAAHEGVLKHNQLVMLMMFLMGLNDVYQNIRSNILARDPLPDVKEAFNVVSREESHRGLHSGSGSSSGNKVQPAAFVFKSNNYKGNDFKKGNSNNNNSSNRGPNPNLLCKNYGLIRHTIERCYEIIGYPIGFNRNLNLPWQGGNSNTKVFNGNSEAQMGASSSSGSTNFDTPFTKDQMMKILSLINEKPTGNASANMAGMRPTFYNGNAMFNLHFEKFFSTQTCSYMYDLSVGWIIDLGANQHFTVSTKNMFNVTDISGLNLTVGHPNGTLAKISAIGNLRLTSNVVLFDVLVIPEYNVSLMSVHKLIKDSKLFVGFDETKYYIQDLNLVKTVRTGSEAAGLYLFDEDQTGDLVHLDLWGPYKVMSRDEYSHTSEIPYDDEREQSKDDANAMAPNNINSSQVVDEDATFATSLTENTNIPKGQHGTDASIPRIISNGLNSLTVGMNHRLKPKSLQEAILDKSWIEAMHNEMEALFKNKTWVLVDLPPNRNTIGCKWLWKIKYKSSGEIERYKARLVAKGFSQRNEIDYEETFSPVDTITLLKPESANLFSLFMDLNKLLDNGMRMYVDDIVITGSNLDEIEKFKSTSAIQIAANPVFHEKIKHFEIGVHLVREKVSSSAISTVKINSAENIADVFIKGLSITQHIQQ
ncbi:ribonuclease H-like domain-containing protein [Tanacetum coccineum]